MVSIGSDVDLRGRQDDPETQCLYYSLVMAVERLSLRVDLGDCLDITCNDSQGKLMGAAQNVIELVPFIGIAPYCQFCKSDRCTAL